MDGLDERVPSQVLLAEVFDKGFSVGLHVNRLEKTIVEVFDRPIVVYVEESTSVGVHDLVLSPVGHFTHIVLYMKKVHFV